MLAKWKSYFGDIPFIYGVAAMLDPQINIEGLRQLITFYYQFLGIENYDVTTYVNQCRVLLEQLHTYYVSVFNPELLSTSSHVTPFKRFDPVIQNILSKKQKTVASSSNSSISGVENYLSHQFETDSDDFHILKWWRQREEKFPILARIAKDILAIPASTIASESAFSAGRRVLDEKRSRLAPESIEMCVCKKDWDQAAKRTQGLKIDDEEDEDKDPFMLFDTDTSFSSDAGQHGEEC